MSSLPLLIASSRFTALRRRLLLFFLLIVVIRVLILSVRTGGDPEATLTVVLHAAVLAAEIDTLALVAVLVAALGKVAGARGKLGLDGCVGGDPVGEGVFAVLDDTGSCGVSVWKRETGEVGESYALLAS